MRILIILSATSLHAYIIFQRSLITYHLLSLLILERRAWLDLLSRDIFKLLYWLLVLSHLLRPPFLLLGFLQVLLLLHSVEASGVIDLDIREAASLESTQALSGCLLLRLIAQKRKKKSSISTSSRRFCFLWPTI